jgi:hypothetical protein
MRVGVGWVSGFRRLVRVEERNGKEGKRREDGAGAQQMYQGRDTSSNGTRAKDHQRQGRETYLIERVECLTMVTRSLGSSIWIMIQ